MRLEERRWKRGRGDEGRERGGGRSDERERSSVG
jgi:hypothetical protein